MPAYDKRDQYDTEYLPGQLTGGETPASDPVVEKVFEDEGQLTELEIHGEEVQPFEVIVTPIDLDGSLVPAEQETKYYLSGSSDYKVGEFEHPVVEVGAQMALSVNLAGTVSADTLIGVNAVTDERTG